MVADVDANGGTETVRLIAERGGGAVFSRADVSRAQDVEAIVQLAVTTYGSLDCAVNNAGIEGVLRPITEISEEDWDRVMNINLKGVFLCMKYELAQMLKQGRGAIANTSSCAGLGGVPTVGAYAASKHGVFWA